MLIDSLLALLAPHDCLGCGAEGRLLCDPCSHQLVRPDSRCYKCHEPSRANATCRGCRAASPLASVQSACQYDGVAKLLIWKLKSGRARSAAREIARHMVSQFPLRRLRGTTLVITHAPTANRRVRQRGYDQAAIIARALARESSLAYAPLLIRRGHSQQVGATRAQRTAQLADAFHAPSGRRIRGAHILLVDDVVTTGATLEHAATALMRAGARRVDAIVFAQA